MLLAQLSFREKHIFVRLMLLLPFVEASIVTDAIG